MAEKDRKLADGRRGWGGGGAKSYDLCKSFNTLWPYSSTHTSVLEEKYTDLIIYLYRDLKIFVCQQSNFLFRLFPVASRCNLSANLPPLPLPPIIIRMPQVFQAA
jgi:hypothetical protein